MTPTAPPPLPFKTLLITRWHMLREIDGLIHHHDFARLINKMDAIAQATQEEIVIQTGLSKTLPQHAQHFDYKPREEVLELQANARVIITHAGIGSISDALNAQRPLIVVPRQKKFQEHNTNHQQELAQAIEKREWGRIIEDIDDLVQACTSPPEPHASYRPAKQPLVDAVHTRIQCPQK